MTPRPDRSARRPFLRAAGFAVCALAAAAYLASTTATPARAQEEKPAETKPDAKPEEKPKAEPKSVAATKGPFSVVLDLSGVLDARQQWDVEMDAEVWGGDLEVDEAAPSGPVEKDQVLVRFRTDKIDEALAAARRDLVVAKANFQKAQDDFRRIEESLATTLRKAEFDLQGAEIAWRRWTEYEKEYRLTEHTLRQQNAKDQLADAAEELAQLEKMYGADEITEETEEIVLRRNRRDFERRKQFAAMNEKRAEEWRTQDYPREAEAAETAVKKARTDYEKAKLAATTGAETAKVEFEKAKTGLAKQEENLAKLERDRERFVLKAPESGLAIRGSLLRGKWSGLEEPSWSLRKDGKVKPKQTLYTVVRGGDVYVRSAVAEGQVFQAAEGQKAVVSPNAAPKLQLPAKVSRVGRVSSGTDYDLFLALDQSDARLLPGHTVKFKLTTLERADAITVPAGAVERDGEKRFVHVVGGDGKAERREVEAGETSGGRTEIVKGLTEGEKVLETAPKQK